VIWQPATYPAVHDLLTNPVYAGAFVFGRTRTEKRIDSTGKVVQRTVLLPREQWAVLIPDRHPGFIDWPTYEANTARLRQNWRAPRGSGGGAPREGSALLQGRLRCGKCGRLMPTGYSGTKGNCPRYVCARAKQLYGGEKGCQSLGGRRLENRILGEMLAGLEPAALAATAQALSDAEHPHTATLRPSSVERAHAERADDSTTRWSRRIGWLRAPWNGRWSEAGAQRAEQDLIAAQARRGPESAEEELAWLSAGADIRAVFRASTTAQERKRCYARSCRVVVTVDSAARRPAADHLARRRCTELEMTDQDWRAFPRRRRGPSSWYGGWPHCDDTTTR
jgi:hypothetical protein